MKKALLNVLFVLMWTQSLVGLKIVERVKPSFTWRNDQICGVVQTDDGRTIYASTTPDDYQRITIYVSGEEFLDMKDSIVGARVISSKGEFKRADIAEEWGEGLCLMKSLLGEDVGVYDELGVLIAEESGNNFIPSPEEVSCWSCILQVVFLCIDHNKLS